MVSGHNYSFSDTYESHARNVLSDLAVLGFPSLDVADFIKLLPRQVDFHKVSFEIMAAVRAYYQGAFYFLYHTYSSSGVLIPSHITCVSCLH